MKPLWGSEGMVAKSHGIPRCNGISKENIFFSQKKKSISLIHQINKSQRSGCGGEMGDTPLVPSMLNHVNDTSQASGAGNGSVTAAVCEMSTGSSEAGTGGAGRKRPRAWEPQGGSQGARSPSCRGGIPGPGRSRTCPRPRACRGQSGGGRSFGWCHQDQGAPSEAGAGVTDGGSLPSPVGALKPQTLQIPPPAASVSPQ